MRKMFESMDAIIGCRQAFWTYWLCYSEPFQLNAHPSSEDRQARDLLKDPLLSAHTVPSLTFPPLHMNKRVRAQLSPLRRCMSLECAVAVLATAALQIFFALFLFLHDTPALEQGQAQSFRSVLKWIERTPLPLPSPPVDAFPSETKSTDRATKKSVSRPVPTAQPGAQVVESTMLGTPSAPLILALPRQHNRALLTRTHWTGPDLRRLTNRPGLQKRGHRTGGQCKGRGRTGRARLNYFFPQQARWISPVQMRRSVYASHDVLARSLHMTSLSSTRGAHCSGCGQFPPDHFCSVSGHALPDDGPLSAVVREPTLPASMLPGRVGFRLAADASAFGYWKSKDNSTNIERPNALYTPWS
jgi:hypothetical protein